jgi:hypothetical protein
MGSFDMDKVGDALVRDLCGKPISGVDRLLVSDALSEFEQHVGLEWFEGCGFSNTMLGEYLSDMAEEFDKDAPRLAKIVTDLRRQYGYPHG